MEKLEILRELNKLADILDDMQSRLNDPLLCHRDFCGHLGIGNNKHLTWFRVIVRTWFFQNTLKYIWKQITAEEYEKIKREYYKKDYDFWGERIFDTYHKMIFLPNL